MTCDNKHISCTCSRKVGAETFPVRACPQPQNRKRVRLVTVNTCLSRTDRKVDWGLSRSSFFGATGKNENVTHDQTRETGKSYLTGRTKMVAIDNDSSKPSILCFGVPQGSVLGPVLFILYTKPLSNLIERHSISSQSFADDTQLLYSCHPDHLDTTVQRMQN